MTKIGSITMNSIEMYAAGGNAKEYFGEAKLGYMILSLLINIMNLITLPIQAVGMIFYYDLSESEVCGQRGSSFVL